MVTSLRLCVQRPRGSSFGDIERLTLTCRTCMLVRRTYEPRTYEPITWRIACRLRLRRVSPQTVQRTSTVRSGAQKSLRHRGSLCRRNISWMGRIPGQRRQLDGYRSLRAMHRSAWQLRAHRRLALQAVWLPRLRSICNGGTSAPTASLGEALDLLAGACPRSAKLPLPVHHALLQLWIAGSPCRFVQLFVASVHASGDAARQQTTAVPVEQQRHCRHQADRVLRTVQVLTVVQLGMHMTSGNVGVAYSGAERVSFYTHGGTMSGRIRSTCLLADAFATVHLPRGFAPRPARLAASPARSVSAKATPAAASAEAAGARPRRAGRAVATRASRLAHAGGPPLRAAGFCRCARDFKTPARGLRATAPAQELVRCVVFDIS